MDEKTLAAAAALVGLTLSEEQIPVVLDQLRRAAQIAQPVLDAPLAPEDEPAPIWTP
jgi:hypothetical protein